MKMYQNCRVVEVCGTQNSEIEQITYGSAIHSSHGRALPQRECVRLTSTPIMTSEVPSKKREMSITRPTVAMGTLASSV